MSTLAARLDGSPRAWMPALAATALAVALGATVARDPRIAALMAAALVAPALVWAEPRVGFLLLALLLGVNIDVLRTPVFVSLPQLAALGLTGAVLVRRPTGVRATGAAAGLLFVLATVPSLPGAIDPRAAGTALLKLGVLAMFLAAAVRAVAERRVEPATLLRWVVTGGLLSLVPAFVQVIFDAGPASFRVGGVMRAYSTYSQPNSYGLYLAGVFPVALGLALAGRRATGLLAAAALLLVIGLTGSRGAWIGAAAGLLAFFAATTRWRASTVAAVAFGALGVVGLVSLVPDGFITGRFDPGDWSLQQRLLLLLTAWDGILRNPVLGYGGGSFEPLLPGIARQGLTDDVSMPHNVLLDIWFHFGLAALLCFVALAALFLVRTFRLARSSADARVAGVFAGTVGMLMAALFGTLFIRGVQETFVLIIAAGAGFLQVARRRSPEGPDAVAVPL